MAKKRTTKHATVGKRILRGLKELDGKLKRGEPIKATTLVRVKAFSVIDRHNGHVLTDLDRLHVHTLRRPEEGERVVESEIVYRVPTVLVPKSKVK